MDRRRFLLTAFAGALTAPLAADAQRAEGPRTIGLLATARDAYHAFKETLRALGWIEGPTVRFESRFSNDYGELSRLATQLVRVPVDIIFAGNAPSVRAAMNATRTIPIVMVSGDPVTAGFVASLARPGANVTGLAIMHTELSGKRLEILTEALPTARRIAVLSNPKNPSTSAMLRETEARARSLGVQILRFEATAPDQLAGAVRAAAREGAEALAVLGDPMFNVNSRHLIKATAQHRLPPSGNGERSWRRAASWRTRPISRTSIGAQQRTSIAS